MSNSVPVPPPAKLVFSCLDTLRGATGELTKLASELQSRLQPVTEDGPPALCEKEKGQSGYGPKLSGAIVEQADLVTRVNLLIREILSGLEV
jgi:hypothetical protein